MRKTDLAKEPVRLCALMTALTATAILLPAPALAAGTGMVANSASAPLLVLTRGNVRMAPAELSSMSKKAGTPLLLTKSIGTGAYLIRPARPTTAQGLHVIAGRLATHPNVLGAQIYRQSAPAYMLAPAGHRVTLNGARLAGSTAPIVSYRWHQILGPNTGVAHATQPTVSFLARQAATPGSSSSDPTAINPGDLTAPPKQLQCAISAASAHRVRINSPVLISKNTFMCDTGNGSTPSAGATPPDSGSPGASTPPTDTGTPGAGTPPVDTGTPGAGSPPSDTGYPSTGSPSDNYAPPSGFNTPSPSSGSPSGGLGLLMCNGECSNATMVPGGNCVGDCSGAKYNGTPSTPGYMCTGNCYGAQGGGNCAGECSNISANSVRGATVRKNAVAPSPVIGYQLIATDKTGVAHVRNIYIRVQPNLANTSGAAKATTRPAKAASPWASQAAKRYGGHASYWQQG